MIEVIKNILRYNRDIVQSRSIKNCHLHGLHSFNLSMPGSEHTHMRAFYAETAIHHGAVAFHMHRRDITLVPVRGSLVNVNAYRTNESGEEYQQFIYKSLIKDGEGAFEEFPGNAPLIATMSHNVERPCKLPGWQYHTVTATTNTVWLVLEGAPTPKYSNVVLAQHDLTKLTFDGLYRPMDDITFESFLGAVGL